MKSFTLNEPINIDGIGLHTGVKTNVILNPAPLNSGIFFNRTDKSTIIPAKWDNVISTKFSTNIASNGVEVKTVEISDKSLEKKQKSKKTKTDPNLFLFNDVVDEESSEARPNSDGNEISELSDISEFNNENENNEDTDTPSYLRKGSNQ